LIVVAAALALLLQDAPMRTAPEPVAEPGPENVLRR
jgi:hypothetical protein